MFLRRCVPMDGASACAFPPSSSRPSPAEAPSTVTNWKTVSILKLIERRYHLAPLGTRDADPKIGDLTSVFED
jgi:hypothetical protein